MFTSKLSIAHWTQRNWYHIISSS